MFKKIVYSLVAFAFILSSSAVFGVEAPKQFTDNKGTRYEVAGNNLIIVLDGKQHPAKDGTYKFTDGSKITVKGGKIVKGASKPKGISPIDPDPVDGKR